MPGANLELACPPRLQWYPVPHLIVESFDLDFQAQVAGAVVRVRQCYGQGWTVVPVDPGRGRSVVQMALRGTLILSDLLVVAWRRGRTLPIEEAMLGAFWARASGVSLLLVAPSSHPTLLNVVREVRGSVLILGSRRDTATELAVHLIRPLLDPQAREVMGDLPGPLIGHRPIHTNITGQDTEPGVERLSTRDPREFPVGASKSDANGDEHQFARLVARNRGTILRGAVSAGLDRDRAEDVVQEVILNLWSRRQVLKRRILEPGWFVQAGRTAARDRIRKRQRRKRLLAEVGNVRTSRPSGTPDIETELDRDRRQVLRGLDALPEPTRMVVNLCGRYGWSVREVGELLASGSEMVKSRYRRGRHRLRSELGSSGDGGMEATRPRIVIDRPEEA